MVRGEDAVAIENIGGSHQYCVDALSKLDAERTATCHMLCCGEGRQGFEGLFIWCDPGNGLHSFWLRNLQVARHYNNLNDRNGAVVALRFGQVQKLLATLRGGTVESVYWRHGARIDGIARRELGQA